MYKFTYQKLDLGQNLCKVFFPCPLYFLPDFCMGVDAPPAAGPWSDSRCEQEANRARALQQKHPDIREFIDALREMDACFQERGDEDFWAINQVVAGVHTWRQVCEHYGPSFINADSTQMSPEVVDSIREHTALTLIQLDLLESEPLRSTQRRYLDCMKRVVSLFDQHPEIEFALEQAHYREQQQIDRS